jgi:precorrin-3B C17-methyltransferase
LRSKGKIFVIGIGPVKKEHMSLKAITAIEQCEMVIGYNKYVSLIADMIKDKKVISFGMKQEVDRCEIALDYAKKGHLVALISSGDAGIYGMAGVMLEVLSRSDNSLEIEIIPGITSSTAAASLLGAPLMHDHAVISLSDLLTEWALIEKRIKEVATGDFVICLYNPRSKTRIKNIEKARAILIKFRDEKTPVGIVKNAMRDGEEIVLTNLEDMLNYDIDMNTCIIIGNSKTYIANNRMITPRGYEIK